MGYRTGLSHTKRIADTGKEKVDENRNSIYTELSDMKRMAE